MKTKSIILGSLFLVSVSSIFVLYANRNDKAPERQGFDRLLPINHLKSNAIKDLADNSYYIAGVNTSHIYMGNTNKPTLLLRIPIGLQHIDTLSLSAPDSISLFSTRMSVNNGDVYITSFHTGTVLKGSLNELIVTPYLPLHISLMNVIPLKGGAVAMRKIKPKEKESVLAKAAPSMTYIKEAPDLLEKQVDGLFCTDGSLIYNQEMDQLIYYYFYRNQFICMDTSLNLLYRANTIDTTNQVNFKVLETESDGSKGIAGIPRIVNKTSAVSGQWLFVNSNSLSQNEDEQLFRTASVIDVYDLSNAGTYQGSLYVPNYDYSSVTEFIVHGNQLIAMHNEYLVTYELDSDILEHKASNIM